MVVRVWHLGVVVLFALLLVGYYVTHASSPSASGGDAALNAEANVRMLVPTVESYNVDNTPGNKKDPNASHSDSGYTGMTMAILRSKYDSALPAAGEWVSPTDPGFPAGVVKVTPTKTTYCVVAMVDTTYAWKLGPSGVVKSSTTPSDVCAS